MTPSYTGVKGGRLSPGQIIQIEECDFQLGDGSWDTASGSILYRGHWVATGTKDTVRLLAVKTYSCRLSSRSNLRKKGGGK